MEGVATEDEEEEEEEEEEEGEGERGERATLPSSKSATSCVKISESIDMISVSLEICSSETKSIKLKIMVGGGEYHPEEVQQGQKVVNDVHVQS